MLKVHIITQNEPFFIPKMIKHILSNQNANYNVISFTVMKPQRKSKTLMHWFRERVTIYKLREILIASFAFLSVKITSGIFSGNINYSARKVFNKYGVLEIPTSNINSTSYIEALKIIEPDVVISISCPQIFGKTLLDIPKMMSLNAHGTLLPRHRGVFGSWWTLFSGNVSGGSTIHKMVTKLDAGDILWQKEFPITKDDTQYSIAYKTKRDMSNGLVYVLNLLNSSQELQIIPYRYNSSYHKAPSRKEGRLFQQKGLRILKFKDLKYIFKSSYE
jgi:methionyl-tRNA formyltransferase